LILFCSDILFAGMTPTLHKSQVHCLVVMQWWACISLVAAPLRGQTWERILLVLVFIT